MTNQDVAATEDASAPLGDPSTLTPQAAARLAIEEHGVPVIERVLGVLQTKAARSEEAKAQHYILKEMTEALEGTANPMMGLPFRPEECLRAGVGELRKLKPLALKGFGVEPENLDKLIFLVSKAAGLDLPDMEPASRLQRS